MRTVIRLAAFTSLFLASACGQKHLSSGFGIANREAFSVQVARPEGSPAPPPKMALDTQEAGVIAAAHVRSLAGKTAKAEPQPVLYVAPQQGGGMPHGLAPSVPKE